MCIIDNENKLIYIAISKCGTTSIQQYFKNIVGSPYIINSNENEINKHSKALDIKSFINSSSLSINYNDYHSFTFIRNPFDWYVSWYEYCKRRRDNNNNNWLDTRNMTFKEFMEIEVNINRKLSKELLDFVIDENDKIIVNTII